METIIDSLFESIMEWSAEDLGSFLCNVYALGYCDAQQGKDARANQTFLLLSPLMQPDIVEDYIVSTLATGFDEDELEWFG